jgi:hypothetical protein
MLELQFFGQNVQFAVSLFAALVFFAVFWLYFDAWISQAHKKRKDIFKCVGFLVVSVSFLIHATIIEQSDFGQPLFGAALRSISTILRLAGYATIIVGQIIDPLQKKPETKALDSRRIPASLTEPIKMPAVAVSSTFGLAYLLPIGALAVAAVYWRRATRGMERHLKPVAIAFLFLFAFELLSLADLLRGTDNPSLFNLVKPFGPLWIAGHVLLLGGLLVLGRWVWHYLTERFLSQLFMIFTSSILVIFLLTTVSFTYLLMRNVQNDALNNLETSSSVLGYALNSKKAETRANAETLPQNSQIVEAIQTNDHKALVDLTSNFLADKQQSSLVITSSSGQVLLRAEDPSRWGDSLSSDSLIRRALIGQTASSFTNKEGVLAPLVYIKTTVPVRDAAKKIVGTISVSVSIDNALVDGIKNATGLDSAVYSGNTLSATTFLAADGKSRLIGVKNINKKVTDMVLSKGQTFKGELDIFNRQYLAVYAPLVDANNNTVGMLFIGQSQTIALQTAGRAIGITFLVAASLLMLSIIPAYLVARHIARQLE